MATTPAANHTPTTGKPPFQRVAQTNDFDCWLACVATLVARPLVEVRQVAVERYKLPAHGPYVFMDDLMIAKLLAHWGFTATVWKESTGIASLPDVAVGLAEFNPETEIGRHVVFVRQRNAAGKPVQEWVIDTGFWVPPQHHVRDPKGFPVSWYIGVTPMRPAGK